MATKSNRQRKSAVDAMNKREDRRDLTEAGRQRIDQTSPTPWPVSITGRVENCEARLANLEAAAGGGATLSVGERLGTTDERLTSLERGSEALGQRVEKLEKEIALLGTGEQIRQAFRRVSALERGTRHGS